VRSLTRREQVRRRLVHDGGHWHVYADVVVPGHGFDFPSTFTHRWVCPGYRVAAYGQVVTISVL